MNEGNYSLGLGYLSFGTKKKDKPDKEGTKRQLLGYMFDRTQMMFEWSGLPETIPARILELYLQYHGHCCFYRYKDDLYVFFGGLGGKPDYNYMPTIYTIANPALELTVQAKINEDCIVMSNDSMYIGLLPMFERYAEQMTETELSIMIATINSRIIDLIGAPDDRTKDSAEEFLRNVIEGKLGVIAENSFLGGINAQPYGTTGNSNTITNLIELMQYQKASWYNEIGLNANYNMKREALNSSESALNDDMLVPLIDNMLLCRQQACEKINEMFGTEISVDFASSWKDNREELEAQQEMLNDPEEPAEEPAEPEEPAGPDEDPEEPAEEPAEETADVTIDIKVETEESEEEKEDAEKTE